MMHLKHLFVSSFLLPLLLSHAPLFGVSVRFACFGLGDEPKEFYVYLHEDESINVKVPRVGFSQPANVNSSTLSIKASDLLPENASNLSNETISVRLPDQGNAFIILLMEISRQDIRPLVIPADSPRFKDGDLIFFNLSNTRVGIKLGKEIVILESYSKRVKTPPQMKDNESYPVEFFAEKSGREKMFSATRWKNQPGVRGYIFILQNPNTGRHYFKAMGEFVANDTSEATPPAAE